ncbi:MAG TPA: maleylacetoacetate isomerase [Rhizomicrobium sp.]|jgi:maleylacetoacetate isomerase|nr:maleylacetoacetate isomerase [Rhizomicrobium sp.]HEX4118661.1 maleylacetoacetate isomerase [Rhizomicrobium sp.]
MSATSDFALYGYFRSSAAFRVRIVLNLKGLQAHPRFVHLLKDGGQQHQDAYKTVNPQELIPTLLHDGQAIGQSLAIIEYLDETVPQPPLLPRDAAGRARVRQIALAIACDIHPLNNLRVLQYLRHRLGAGDTVRADWQQHWIAAGFSALEAMAARDGLAGRFCHGDAPSLADVCLIPQMANARRIQMNLSPYPTLRRIEDAAYGLPAFIAARPENQPDAE